MKRSLNLQKFRAWKQSRLLTIQLYNLLRKEQICVPLRDNANVFINVLLVNARKLVSLTYSEIKRCHVKSSSSKDSAAIKDRKLKDQNNT